MLPSILAQRFETAFCANPGLRQVKAPEQSVQSTADLAAIIEQLDLRRPIYGKTASYGHFGRDIFPWEKTDRVEQLTAAL